MSGLDDKLAGLPDGATPPPAPGNLARLRADAVAFRVRHADQLATLNAALTKEFERLYGPAIIGAQYLLDRNHLQVGVRRDKAVDECTLLPVAHRHGYTITPSSSSFATFHPKGSKDIAGYCHTSTKGDGHAKYVVTVALDHDAHEDLLNALLEDYLGLTRVQDA